MDLILGLLYFGAMLRRSGLGQEAMKLLKRDPIKFTATSIYILELLLKTCAWTILEALLVDLFLNNWGTFPNFQTVEAYDQTTYQPCILYCAAWPDGGPVFILHVFPSSPTRCPLRHSIASWRSSLEFLRFFGSDVLEKMTQTHFGDIKYPLQDQAT